MLRKSLLCLLLTICSALTSACWDQRPIEDQAIVIVIGADINQQNSELIDLTFGIPLFDESKSSFARITTASGVNFGNVRDIWQAGSALTVATGKIRLLLFGEAMAATGLPGFINYVQSPSTDNNALVAVVRGRAEDLLQGRLTETERIGTNTANQLRNASKAGLTFAPEVNDLMTTFTSAGKDPIMPLLELSTGKDVIQIVGSALFQDLNMVGEISLAETQLLLALSGKPAEVTFAPALGTTGELHAPPPHLRLLSPQAKLTPRVDSGQLTVKVDFQANYNLRQYYSIKDVTKLQTAESITQDLESNLNLAIQQLLAKLQAAKTDPLGIGKKYRVKNNDVYDDNAFREMWAKANLEIEVDLRFNRAGTNLQSERKKP